jgi:hypothetical protein
MLKRKDKGRNCFDNVTFHNQAIEIAPERLSAEHPPTWTPLVRAGGRSAAGFSGATSSRQANLTLSNCSALNHKERKEGAKITKKGKKPAIFAHFVISLWSSW